MNSRCADDHQTEANTVPHCFRVVNRLGHARYSTMLDAQPAAALAALLPLLGCGEEAAAVGFDRLSRGAALDTSARLVMRKIADDERCHDAMLRGLRAALPPVVPNVLVQNQARRFHLSLPRGGTYLHLARIAGLDAAVCTILSRLLRPGCPTSRDDRIRSVLSQIRGDEAHHLIVSREIALAAPDRKAVRNAAAEARVALAGLLTSGSAAFEALGVDPDRLVRDIGCLPNGLLPQ